MLLLLSLYLLCVTCYALDSAKKPHIVVITADDMGWNDVSYHGSNVIQTPNIDALAYYGTILNDFHTSSLCTPSRSALMTGEFPIHTGTQHSVILEAEPSGLPLNRKLLPEYLKDAGYRTHMIGKWHLGFYKKEYTPTKRGFDSFYGYWQGHQDYFSHNVEETYGPFVGYDMRKNLDTDWTTQGEYSTDLFTNKAVQLINAHDEETPLFLYLSQIAPHAGAKNDPLQVPQSEVDKFSHIPNLDKRKFAAMISKLDESVGKVIEALNAKNMLENSVILFMSDNGAPTVGIYATTGSNYPFRGMKASEWEGGTRVPAVIWSPLFTKQQRVSNMMMHMVDVLPTLYSAAGMNSTELRKVEGISMWQTLLDGNEISPRTEYPYNIDPAQKNKEVGAIRVGDWKYFQGTKDTIGRENDWHYDILSLEHFFNDEHYNPQNIMKSLTSQAISSLYQKINKNTKANQPEEENEVDKEHTTYDILTSEKILQLRTESKIKCQNIANDPPCMLNESPCLINLQNDPCEKYNIADNYPQKFQEMQQRFEEYRRKVVPPINKPRDEDADPSDWNGVWVNWRDYDTKSFFKTLRKLLKKVKSIPPKVIKCLTSAY